MRILMKNTAAGPAGAFQAGYEYGSGTIPEELAKAFVESGAAELLPDLPEAPPVESLPEPETATKKQKTERREGPPRPPSSPENDEEPEAGPSEGPENSETGDGEIVAKAWPLRMEPERYLAQFGEEAKYGSLAKEILSFREATEG